MRSKGLGKEKILLFSIDGPDRDKQAVKIVSVLINMRIS
jgi:hypothetical protein